MNKALLVTGGDAPELAVMQDRFSEFTYICAADSGLDTLRSWGLYADLAVGDFDSLKDHSALKLCREVLRHPAAKDDSDTELAVSELFRRGYSDITLAGGGGGRLDHLLALRALFDRPKRPNEWLSAMERVLVVERASSFRCKPGATVSVFPLNGHAEGMRSAGLAWPLDGLVWDSSGFGLSNLCPNGTFTLWPGNYPLLLILPVNAQGPLA
ncbi:MAG TPA: thiamine diphosphokinase [Spirochaetales bacterium]|nr:thiamine diphosphokinase [Spirochaetales bacterium]